MKKIIMIGKTGCGKTTLCQRLHQVELVYRKTQAVDFYHNAIDTPGEYLENRNFYRALVVLSAEAELIALVVDPLAEDSFFPPLFGTMFTKPMIGIVSKCTLAQQQQLIKAQQRLQESGVEQIFCVDAVADVGMVQLANALAGDDIIQ